MKRADFITMLDGEFAEGCEILDIMQMAVNDPDAVLTEREKCRLFMGRYLYAAAVEATNRATQQFAIAPADLMADFWAMAGEAVGCVTVQAFDSAPRSRRAVRKFAKETMMSGYDHLIALVDEHDAEAKKAKDS
ncbi:hypothetical protein ATY76_13255 [Rhizobium sp. R339]|uniref:hypothetical protein n=1 Tax=Rhizobium sp. R339 TaxID=1764273 RepID=UPI000B52B9AB|nr:hypothetical protein [Rhizobium sp. R339]OWV67892.1 hypothetical protein ATY76_13255 [Rhizobium sp. R339]